MITSMGLGTGPRDVRHPFQQHTSRSTQYVAHGLDSWRYAPLPLTFRRDGWWRSSWGRRAAGVAVCDEAGILATPLVVIGGTPHAPGILPRSPRWSRGSKSLAWWSACRWTARGKMARRRAGSGVTRVGSPVRYPSPWLLGRELFIGRRGPVVSEGGGRTPRNAAAAAVIFQEYLEAPGDSSRRRRPVVVGSVVLARFVYFLSFVFCCFLAAARWPCWASSRFSFMRAQLEDTPEPSKAALVRPPRSRG